VTQPSKSITTTADPTKNGRPFGAAVTFAPISPVTISSPHRILAFQLAYAADSMTLVHF
jgi:hypothetical protein